ncbi:MAG: outer membrane beta-barrel protein [Flavobacteriia bacterium]|nr:outer membrane beta-barrel protein [Flavobacteriia bacterium]NCP05329.1 outer membrane beta-barrel protein [Flavobacteriales bacterium]
MLLLIPTYSFSQYEVSGIVKDSSDIFIEFANVVLTNLDNEIISGTITDGNGIFNLSVEEGEYRLIISFIGYQNWTKNITVSSDNDFGVITLIESKNELDEVLVTAKKPMIEQKVDRLVFNISENAFAKGKNALKALELAPMVWVSSKGDISINGRGGVRVVVNGKLLQEEVSQSYLSSLRSEDIESIEIIPNPPAEYAAEIKSGIVNIILKKNIQESLNGNINTSYTQHRFSSYSGGGSLNYKTGKWLLYGSYNYSQDKDFFDREVETVYEPENTKRLTNFQSIEKSVGNTYRFGFDYDINLKHQLGIEYYSYNNNFREAIDNEVISFNNDVLAEVVKGDYPGKVDKKKESYTLNYNWEIDTIGKKLIFLTDYYIYNKKRTSDYFDNIYNSDGTFLDSEISRGKVGEDIAILTSQLDYIHPLEKTTFQAGFKFSDANLDDENTHEVLLNEIYEIDPQKTTSYDFNEKVSAAYLKASTELGNIQFQFGLRGEYTQNQFKNNPEKNYFSAFPSVFANHNINKLKNTSLRYYYGRKISRPSYNLMSPYEYLIDKYTVFRGNEDLKPQYNNRFSITYYIGNKYSFQGFYSFTKDIFDIVEYSDPLDSSINVETTENIGESHSYGFHNNNNLKIAKWWKTYTGLGVNFTKTASYDKSFKTDNLYFYINHRSSINLPLGLDCTINARFLSPALEGIYESDEIFNFNLGLQKEVLKSKCTISLDISDVFYTGGKYHLTSNYKDQYSNTYVERPGQIIMLSFSYNFFSGTKFKKERKEKSNQEELQRI